MTSATPRASWPPVGESGPARARSSSRSPRRSAGPSTFSRRDREGAMRETLRANWPEYLMEAAGLGIFMVSACTFATLFEHPASPVRQAIADPLLRRILVGLAMGLTAVGLIYSPW